jgi:hypothetical protein
MFKKIFLALGCAGVLMLACTGSMRAQDEVSRFEAGAQFVGVRLAGTGEGALGFGGRLGVNATRHLGFETALNYFPQNPSGDYGETLLLSGVKLTQRMDRLGFFALVQPGWIHFGGPALAGRLSAIDHFALNAGGGVEFYKGTLVALRLDVGDLIIPYGGTTILRTPVPSRLGTQHNLTAGFGITFRF